MTQLSQTIAQDLKLSSKKVQAALDLFDTGATVPFVARYRKEATGGLDEVQLRAILDRKGYFTDLEQRRKTILQAIGEQGKLTSDLERRIRDASSKTALEDLYAPFKKRRKTRADTAREKGLAPLARGCSLSPGMDTLCRKPDGLFIPQGASHLSMKHWLELAISSRKP